MISTQKGKKLTINIELRQQKCEWCKINLKKQKQTLKLFFLNKGWE